MLLPKQTIFTTHVNSLSTSLSLPPFPPSLQLVEQAVARELQAEQGASSVDKVVNTDDENEEEEYEAWKVRELKRMKRDREEREK